MGLLMKNKMRIQYGIVLLLVLTAMPFVLAGEITTDSYSIDAHHTGTATSGNSSTGSYGFRYTTTYEQGSNRDVATQSYSANSGWLNNSLYTNNDELAAESVCDSNNLNLCVDEPGCSGAGGYWYNNVCNSASQPQEENATKTQKHGDGGVATGRVVDSIQKTIRDGRSEELRKKDKIEIKISNKNYTHIYLLELVEFGEEDALIRVYIAENYTESKKGVTGKAIEDSLAEYLAFRIKLGEEKKIDLTEDGFYDLYISLDEIRDGRAFIYIESIHEEIVKEVEKIEVREAEESEVGLMSKINFVFAFIIAALVLVVLGFFFRGRFKMVYLKGRLEQLGRLRERRAISKRTYESEKEGLVKTLLESIGPRGFAVVLAGLLAIVIFGFGAKMSGFTIAATTGFASDNVLGIVLFAILVIAAVLAVVHRKRIKEHVTSIGKKHPKNSIRGLIKKKVYTEDGNYVGVVKDVVLHENKIYSLKISLGKKLKSKKKGIVVKYKNVHRTGHVVILDKKVAGHL